MGQQTQEHPAAEHHPLGFAHAGYAAAVGEAIAPLVEHVTVVVDHAPGRAVTAEGGTDAGLAAVPVLGIAVEVHDGPEPAPGSDHPPAWLRLTWNQVDGWSYQFPHEVGRFAPEHGHQLMDARVPAPHDLAGWLAAVIQPRSAAWRDTETEPAPDTVLAPELAALVDDGVVTAAMAAQLAVYQRPVPSR
ncbi:hypothetical protein [Yinghuangia sp. YIM S09857]|uniref:hypothetical protein n=1 Tax=Yinghuangia sp. YIM S09857 TaxID=3436929 RepID=UPI003F53AFB6